MEPSEMRDTRSSEKASRRMAAVVADTLQYVSRFDALCETLACRTCSRHAWSVNPWRGGKRLTQPAALRGDRLRS